MYQSILDFIIADDSSYILWIYPLWYQSLAPKTRDNVLTTAILHVCIHVHERICSFKIHTLTSHFVI